VVNGDGCDALCTGERIALLKGREGVANEAVPANQADIFTFVVDGPSTLDARTIAGRAGDCRGGSLDTVLELRSVDGQGNLGAIITSNDDAAGLGLCSRIQAAPLAAGTYALRVDGFGNRQVNRYSLRFRLHQVASNSGDYAGAFAQNGNDIYAVTVANAGDYAFVTSNGQGGCPGDTYMTLFSVDNQDAQAMVERNDDGGQGVCSRIARALQPGRYDVEVRGFGNRAINAYTLTVAAPGVCGDGNVDQGEQCDDGNVVDGDGCSAQCQNEARCGDGNVDQGEQCDDGNNDAGDGCDAQCQNEPRCGDGNVDQGEECDDGNNDAGDGCNAQCQNEPACGDNNVDPGEECDDGNVVDGDGCTAGCSFEHTCGDGNLEDGELCDDGNVVNGDGCDALCTGERIALIKGREEVANEAVPANQADIFTFVVDGPSTLDARTIAGPAGACRGGGQDTVLELRSVDGQGNLGAIIVSNDDAGGELGVCSRIQRAPLALGTYALRVDGFANQQVND
jgi:cysteine-rich repeat protein